MADVNLRAIVEGFEEAKRSLDKVGNELKDLAGKNKQLDVQQKKASESAKQLGQALALALAAAGAAVTLAVKRSIDAADAMGKLSQSTGIATETLSELAHAADLSGVSTGSLAQTLNLLNKNINDTAAGTGEAKDAFAALGIEVKDSEGVLKNADRIMAEVADKFRGMEDGAGKSAISMRIFGQSGAALIPLLNAGRQGIEEMRKEARDLGIVFDSDATAAAERFNDSLTKLGAVQRGLANAFAQALLPSLEAITNEMIASAKSANELKSIFGGFVTVAKTLAAGLLTVGSAIVQIGVDAAFTVEAVKKLMTEGVEAAKGVLKEMGQAQVQSQEDVTRRIQAIWGNTATATEGAAERIVKSAAPILKTTAQLAKEEAALAKARKDAADAKKAELDEYIKLTEAQIKLDEDYKAKREQDLADMQRFHADNAEREIKKIEEVLIVNGELVQMEGEERVKALERLRDAYAGMGAQGVEAYSKVKEAIKQTSTEAEEDAKRMSDAMGRASFDMTGALLSFRSSSQQIFSQVLQGNMKVADAFKNIWKSAVASVADELARLAANEMVRFLASLMGFGVGGSGAGGGIGGGAPFSIPGGGGGGGGGFGGAASGAAMGASIGSVVPVIGTALGAIVGGIGGFLGVFASGGERVVTRPSLFMAGESGPEHLSVRPLAGAAHGGGGGVAVNFNSIAVVDEFTLRRFVRSIEDSLRQNNRYGR